MYKMSKLKQRMYGLVPYNISPIQQGIQFGHAVVEYGLVHRGDEYNQWAYHDKTFVILNGGTTNNSLETPGTLNGHINNLINLGIKASCFYEPDLGDQLTAVVFLVDERVWDYETYPNYEDLDDLLINKNEYYRQLFGDDWARVVDQREFLLQFKIA